MLATVRPSSTRTTLPSACWSGVLLSGIFFAWKIAQLFRVTTLSATMAARTYTVEGQLFFASVEDFMKAFDFKEAPEKRGHRRVPRPHLGHQSVAGARHGDPEVPPRRGRGGGRRHERGDGDACRPAGVTTSPARWTS
jgi:hypothetical protein